MDQNKTSNDTSEMDFQGLILGLSGAALHYLGETQAAGGAKEPANLALARQNIEIIAMLSEKTKGNLTRQEENLMQQVLLDLRMRFIEKTKATAK